MLSTAVGVAVLAALVLLGSALLTRLRGRKPLHATRAGDALVLRPPRFLNLALAASGLAPAAIVAALALRVGAGASPAGRALAAALGAAGLAAAAWVVAAEVRQRTRVDAEGIERTTPTSRRKMAWSEVARIAYNPTARWFFLTGAGGGRLWISEDQGGIGDFAAMALARLPPRVLAECAEAREVLQELADEARGG